MSTSHDNYVTRFTEEWEPKEERYASQVQMLNAIGDLPVVRVEHLSTEPDYRTSMESRAALVPCAPHVRQHAIVLFSAGDKAIRQRALDELKRLMDEDPNNGALEVLMQFDEWKRQD
jgi:hypothetical protein